MKAIFTATPGKPVSPQAPRGGWPYVAWAVLISALILILTLLAFWQESERNQERAVVTTQNLSLLLAKEVAHLLTRTDALLRSAAFYYHDAQAHEGIDGARFNAHLVQQKSLLPELLDLLLLDEEGELRYGTGDLVAINVADRAYFAEARDDPAAGLIFEGPLLTRGPTKRWALLLARRLSHPDGRFAGVVLGVLPIEAFEGILSQLDLGGGGTAALRTADLLQVARYPRLEGTENGVGNRKVSQELQALMKTHPQGATYATTTLLDKVFRTYSYRQVGDYPFILLVGHAARDFLAHWQKNAAILLGLSGLMMLIVGLASWGLFRASQRLKEAEARWNFALEGSAQGVWDWDLAQGTIYSSPGNQRLFGYPDEERTDPVEVWFDRIHPEDRAAIREAERHARGETPLYAAEYRLRHRDGRYLWVESRGMAVAGGAPGPARRIIGTHTDITARRALEERLRDLNTDLESKVAERTTQLVAANRAKSEFLANMSHEIRTPMSAIIGLSRLLLESDLAGRQRDYLQRIYQSATALLNILNDILDYSKIEAGHLTVESVPMSLREVLAGTRALFALQAEEKHLTLNFTTAPEVPNWLLGDPLRLRQVLNNLVGNALKFTNQGAIEVKVERLEQTPETLLLKVSVQDSGVGLTPDQSEHLFEPFQQADNSTTRRYGGTGLGLSISKRLVELMGGDIGITSQAGAGSTFWFTARLGLGAEPQGKAPDEPQVRDATNPALASPADLAPQGPGLDQVAHITWPIRGARVLVVDDNATNLLVMGDYLTRLGLVAETVASGRAAVEKAARNRYDAILMDLQMPEMDGFAATGAIRAQGRAEDPPIIALSAAVMPQDREASEAAGMCAHVAKPIDPLQLAHTLVQWIRMPPRAATPAPRIEDAKAGGEAFSLPDLDLDHAVQMLGGDWGMLRRVLISFHQSFVGAPVQLAEALRQEQWDVARRLVHTIKGLTTTVGARGLHPLAQRFEQQLAQGETTLQAEFQAALNQVLAAIAQLPELSSPADPLLASPGGADTRREDLAEIEAWLRKHRKVPGTLLQRLGGDWGSPEASGLRDALLERIGQFDYARALETLTLLRETLPS